MRTKECGLWCSLCAEHMKNIEHQVSWKKWPVTLKNGFPHC